MLGEVFGVEITDHAAGPLGCDEGSLRVADERRLAGAFAPVNEGLIQTTMRPRDKARATAWVVFRAPNLKRALST